MQAGEPAAHGVQIFFAQRAFDVRKQFVFLEAHMIVEKFCEVRHGFRIRPATFSSRGAAQKSCTAPRISAWSASMRIATGILIEPHMPGIGGQQHFFLFPKMFLTGLVPERDQLGRLPLDRRIALFGGSFLAARRIAERLNQREVVVLAQRMQAGVAFQIGASRRKRFKRC